ncbi:MAG: Holliday junction resolvase RuvX [Candidatus Arcticimaribacter sp.]|nr:MAG: Holliday junction resolvase RuvX [Candidatus Arcticimaribacter sp.]PTM01828.1 MAG: Holliday junction resolvase RuvX [Candidatus Arcticimaribacter sp.]
MPEIIAIDFGTKRTGIAATDPLQLVASGLTTLPTREVVPFLENYLKTHEVATCVLGQPKRHDGSLSEVETEIKKFIAYLSKKIPSLSIERYDERFTSKMAFQTLLDSGIGKKKRQDKGLLDKISATLILQSYLEANNNTSL